LRTSFWDILVPITDDPDPNDGRGEQMKDPMSTAINSTRGTAMEAVMRYLGWVREGITRPDGVGAFEDMPEAEALLTRHLDPAVEASPAIRVIYGQWLFFLHRLAPAWLEAHLDQLFPILDPDLANVVLEGYAVYGQYTSPDVRRLLEPTYRRALRRVDVGENASRTEREAPRRIGQHLIFGYLEGDLPIEAGSLLVAFFDAVSPSTGADTLAFAIHASKEDDEPAAVERCKTLWEWRADVGDPGELRAFGRWVADDVLDPAWRLAQLEAALRKAGQLDYEFDLMPTLAGLVHAHSEVVLRCTKLAIDAATHWRLYSYMHDGDLRRVLEGCMAAGTPETQREAHAVANALVARDFLDFRDLAEGKAPTGPATRQDTRGKNEPEGH
jgi:hypothetical protein